MADTDTGKPGGNAGGQGKEDVQKAADGVAAIASTLDSVVKIAKSLEALDDLTSRSVICEIDNVTGHQLDFDTSDFDHGGAGPELPPSSIVDKAAGVFSARSSGVLVGVQGTVRYRVDDGAGSLYSITFENPEAGGNSSGNSIEGPVSNRYFIKTITGNGNHGARMRYIIGTFKPPFSLKFFLTNAHLPVGSIRGLSPAVTSIRALMKV